MGEKGFPADDNPSHATTTDKSEGDSSRFYFTRWTQFSGEVVKIAEAFPKAEFSDLLIVENVVARSVLFLHMTD